MALNVNPGSRYTFRMSLCDTTLSLVTSMAHGARPSSSFSAGSCDDHSKGLQTQS